MSENPRLIAVCLRDPEGIDTDAFVRLQQAIEARSPAWSAFLNPHSFVVFFDSDASGQSRAGDRIQEVTGLATGDPLFERIRVGRSEGDAIAVYGADGKLEGMPLGVFVNDALAQASAV